VKRAKLAGGALLKFSIIQFNSRASSASDSFDCDAPGTCTMKRRPAAEAAKGANVDLREGTLPGSPEPSGVWHPMHWSM
jgi:hypothetical protein